MVVNWLAALDRASVFTTTITQAEILYGIESLLAATGEIFGYEFAGQILSFDEDAARDAAGRPNAPFDAMIAAIARVHDAIELVDPWKA
jgi:toxin FitB